MTTTGHTLKVVLDRDTVCLSVVCHEPDGAFCRRACEKGCEDACSNPAGHIKPIDYCLGAEWIEIDNNADECYAGRDEGELPLSDGMPISLSWNGDHYEWAAVAQCVALRNDMDPPARCSRSVESSSDKLCPLHSRAQEVTPA